MRLILAPMEGIADHSLRDILTRLGGIDLCVAEFVRVTNHLLTKRTFLNTVPELARDGCTRAGVPVRVQLLGSDPICLAENAALAASIGAPGIDLNFGCPSPMVNRHGGGAVLLQFPEQIHAIVAATRRAVPKHLPVTAKMRLGLEDTSLALDCARAIEAGGADEITVHARTRDDRYRPPRALGMARPYPRNSESAGGGQRRSMDTAGLSKNTPAQRLQRRHDRARRHYPPGPDASHQNR
jgi:tRNA-dihydrouridine synthase C